MPWVPMVLVLFRYPMLVCIVTIVFCYCRILIVSVSWPDLPKILVVLVTVPSQLWLWKVMILLIWLVI